MTGPSLYAAGVLAVYAYPVASAVSAPIKTEKGQEKRGVLLKRAHVKVRVKQRRELTRPVACTRETRGAY